MSPLRKHRPDRRWNRDPGTGLILPRRPTRERYIEPRGSAQCCCGESAECDITCVGFDSPYGMFPAFPGDVQATVDSFADNICTSCGSVSIDEELVTYYADACPRVSADLALCAVTSGVSPDPCPSGCGYSAIIKRVGGYVQKRDCDGTIDYRGVLEINEAGYCSGFYCFSSEQLRATLTSDWFALTGSDTLQSVFAAGVTCDNVELTPLTGDLEGYEICDYSGASGTLTYTAW